jgi:hypothetical protein
MEGGCQLPLGVYFGDTKIYAAHAANANEAARFFQFETDARIADIISALSN